MAWADQSLKKEDMENTLSMTSQEPANPMYSFVHEHLLSILTPFAEHVKELEMQVAAFRKDFLEQSVELKQCLATQRAQDSLTKSLKSQMDQLALKSTKSQQDVQNLIEVFSKVNCERQEKLRQGLEEEMAAIRSKLTITIWQEEAKKQLKELHEIAKAHAVQLAQCEAKESQLQEASELNKFCFHGLSDRLEQTKGVADATSSDLQRLKTVESCHHGDLQELLKRLTRRLDRTDSKVQENHSELTRTCEKLQSGLSAAEGGIETVTEAIASLDQNMREQLLQYEEHTEADQTTSTNALERLANHVHRTREELSELTHRLHGEVTDSVGALGKTVSKHEHSLQLHEEKLEALEGSSSHLDEGVRKAHQLCSELNQAVDSVWQKAQNADNEIRSLIVNSDTTGIDLENMQHSLSHVTGHLQIAQRDLQVAKSEVHSMAEQLATMEGVLANTVRRLDLDFNYWSGFSRGLQDTEQEVFEGKSGMLLQKAEVRPRHLPALPTPRPHSTDASGLTRFSADAEPPQRPSTSMM